MSDEKLPNWILKVLPVLTGHMSLSKFEEWIYLPKSEHYFPSEVYFELISFNYSKNLSAFIDCLKGIISFENREVLYSIVDFIRNPSYLYTREWDTFKLLPVSELLLEYIWETIDTLQQNIYWSEWLENEPALWVYSQLLNQYLETMVLLLHDYEQYEVINIIRKLNKVYRLKMEE